MADDCRVFAASTCCSLMDCTTGCSYPMAVIGERYCGIVPAAAASEHCGTRIAVAALTERARSATRVNILAAIVAKRLLVGFKF